MYRFSFSGVADDDITQSALKVIEVFSQTENRHDLRGNRDVETTLPRESIGDTAQRNRDLAQRPVVHIYHASPGHPPGIQLELVAPVNMVIHQGRQQVVGSTNSMKIAGEMQINVFHRHYLRITTPGGPTLHAKTRAQTGLS